ncbi:HAD family hydrolase [Niallia sp. FSL R7-0271]|uniref:HAD family hydrolase n=1 Tax=Niallia sp. FSL R7-0271 TaxID=2921678 RepID=UPI0030F5D15E
MEEKEGAKCFMIKAVLFDLDGTLLNRDESVLRFADRQYERLKKWTGHIPKDTYINRFIVLDAKGYVWKDKVYRQLVEEFCLTGITSQELLQDYLDEFSYSCVPFPNVKEMLEELAAAGYRLGIITNGFGKFQMGNIEALRIRGYFDAILISEWEGVRKPDPAIFLRALQRMDTASNQSIFVGDHPQNDIAAASHVGMVSVWKENAQWSGGIADYTVTDLGEIPNLLHDLKNNS